MTNYFWILSYGQLGRGRLPKWGGNAQPSEKSSPIKEVNQGPLPKFLVTFEDIAGGFFGLNVGD